MNKHLQNALASLTIFCSCSIWASEEITPQCPPELSNGFEMLNGALDISSKRVIAIDPVSSQAVFRQLASQSPAQFLILLQTVSLDGEVTAAPMEPLSLSIPTDFSVAAAQDVYHFLNQLHHDSDLKSQAPEARRRQLWSRVFDHVPDEDYELVQACAMIHERNDQISFFLALGTNECVNLVRASRSNDSFEPAPGVIQVELARSDSEEARVVLPNAPWPLTGSASAPLFTASSIRLH